MSLGSPSSPALNDVDLVWGETDDVQTQEWSKMNEDFSNAGYRKGITAGKEAALQEGFDEGFAMIGAPLGREIGVLRGAANATMSVLLSSMSDAEHDAGTSELHINEVRGIIGSLGRIHLMDLSPRDLQAEEHAREHLENEPSWDRLISKEADAKRLDTLQSMQDRFQVPNGEHRPAVEELHRLRAQLSNVLQEIGLELPSLL